jgi:chromosomal replication initiation ATPase DnaA
MSADAPKGPPKRQITAACCKCGTAFQLEQTHVAGNWWPTEGICDACDEEHVKKARGAQPKAEKPIWQRRTDEFTPEDFRVLIRAKLPMAITSYREPASSHETAMKWTTAAGRSLLLVGDTGLGKTRTMFALAAELMRANPLLNVLKFDCISFGEESKARRFTGKGAEWFRYMARIDLVIFDDLFRGVLDEQVQEELFALISTRCDAKKPIIATTQFTGDTMAQVLKAHHVAALSRRFRDYFQVVPFLKPQPSLKK